MIEKGGQEMIGYERRRILCEDTVEGIFTGVYEIYEKKYDKSCIELKVSGKNENYQLFTMDEVSATDMEKSIKVARTIQRNFGMESYYALLRVAFSTAEDKAQVIFKTIKYGLEGRKTTDLLDNLQNSTIFRVFEINRMVNNEASRYVEFSRFEELENGVLFAEIAPENYVLPLLAEHFTNRLKNENFIIYDRKHKASLVYKKGKQWELFQNMELQKEKLEFAKCEENIKKLWQSFFCAISIEERRNTQLQKQLLPLKFRKFMTEFM